MIPEVERVAVALSWSGGKDSALALRILLEDPAVRVEALLTTLNRDLDRINMHGVRRELLEAQAESLRLPLWTNGVSTGSGNLEYEAAMAEAFTKCRLQGVSTVAFGDLYLEDIRAYRDRMISANGMRAIYPVWRRDTDRLIGEFLDQGFKAVVVCVDPSQLDPAFVGREIDAHFVADLPKGVDPCGENGEFHSFVFDGPIFHEPVQFQLGETMSRQGFWFCDLLPRARIEGDD